MFAAAAMAAGLAPINLISEIAVPISLSLRLFANVLSGTVMMALVYGLLGWIATIWPAVLHVYFDSFSGAIQTYVFCMLTMTYISNARGRGMKEVSNRLQHRLLRRETLWFTL